MTTTSRLGPLLAAALVLAGCGDKDDEDTDTPDTAGDTDPGVDTDTTPGESGDTGTQTCSDFSLGGTMEPGPDQTMPAGAVTVMMAVLPLGGDGLEVGDAWATTTTPALTAGAATPFELCFPEVPEDSLFYVPEDTADTGKATAEIATFLVGAFVDADGDGLTSDGDTLVGASVVFPVYVRGELDDEMTKLGAQLGWNLLIFDFASKSDAPSAVIPIESGYADFDLPTNLLPNMPSDIGAILVPSGGGDVKVDLMSMQELMGAPAPADAILTSVDVDAAKPGASFAVPLATPDADHWLPPDPKGGLTGVETAAYLAFAYVDDNDNDVYDDGEAVVGSSVAAGDDSRWLIYLHPTDLGAAFFTELFGGMGWGLYALTDGKDDGPPPQLDWSDGLVLDNIPGTS